MQEVGLSLLTRWQNFYVIIGAAGATLTGLMFVATTLYAGVELQASSARAGLEAFATPTIVLFAEALLVAAILSAPWQALWQAGLMLGLAGLGGIVLVVIAIRWERRQTAYQSKLADWVWYRTLPVASYAALILVGILLPGKPAPALFITGAVTVALLLIGIRNAWDSVTYLAIERSLHENEDRD